MRSRWVRLGLCGAAVAAAVACGADRSAIDSLFDPGGGPGGADAGAEVGGGPAFVPPSVSGGRGGVAGVSERDASVASHGGKPPLQEDASSPSGGGSDATLAPDGGRPREDAGSPGDGSGGGTDGGADPTDGGGGAGGSPSGPCAGSADCPPLPHATAVCQLGACSIEQCDLGFADCDGALENGCEAFTQSDPNNCGGCGNVCGGACSCVASYCELCACSSGTADCDADGSNGCEANLLADPSNCGACGVACGAAETCSLGQCLADHCFDLASSGDETDVDCGGSCPPCTVGQACLTADDCAGEARAAATCCADTCALDCDDGFDDCDADPSNGCETVLASSPAHCGACGSACLPSEACVDGLCRDAQCAWPLGDCDAVFGCDTYLSADVAHCGACDSPCVVANGTPGCEDGTCTVAACDPGFDDCNGLVADGCEADLSFSSVHCGACGNSCGPGCDCVAGECSSDCGCGARRADCDLDPSNGCESDIWNDPLNCGACGNVCSALGGCVECVSGTCPVYPCQPPLADCDSNSTNGCETDLSTDPSNCGGCGVVCTNPHGTSVCSGFFCDPNQCVPSCDPGWGDCDGNPTNGCETDLLTSREHCGACGNACPIAYECGGLLGCASGVCGGSTCAPGTADCDGGGGCETDIESDPSHCGGCGIQCPPGANAVAVCASCTCALDCDAGWADCDGDPSNGCEEPVCGGQCPAP